VQVGVLDWGKGGWVGLGNLSITDSVRHKCMIMVRRLLVTELYAKWRLNIGTHIGDYKVIYQYIYCLAIPQSVNIVEHIVWYLIRITLSRACC
jgi:hypothetical protein